MRRRARRGSAYFVFLAALFAVIFALFPGRARKSAWAVPASAAGSAPAPAGGASAAPPAMSASPLLPVFTLPAFGGEFERARTPTDVKPSDAPGMPRESGLPVRVNV